jgi:hypothetical protein
MVLSDFLSLLAQGLLVIAIPVLIAFLFQWVRQHGAEVRGQLTAQQQQVIDTAIAIAVRAAEQSCASNQLAGGGQAKKAYAIKVSQDYLNRLGVRVDVTMLVALIESEVQRQFASSAPVVDDAATRSALLDKAVETAVLAAEQSGMTGVIQDVAAQKKRYALDMAFRYLSDHGLRVDPGVVDGLIEAQVLRLKMPAVNK